ncbi:hypothetical protein HK102_009302, partial [Quaeritorhiza haematococci]
TCLLVALVAALIGTALTSPIFGSGSDASAQSSQQQQQQQQQQQLYIPGDKCPSGYSQKNSGCVLNGAQFHLETQNGLISTYVTNVPTSNSNKPQSITAHHVVFTVYGTAPGSGEKVPVAGIPVEIKPTEADQVVITVDKSSGDIRQQTVKKDRAFTVVSNLQGRATFSVPILGDEQVDAQKMKARVDYMDAKEWHGFHADTAAMAALGKVTRQQIQAAKSDIPDDVADDVAERVRTLISIPSENDNRVFVNPAKQTISLQQQQQQSNALAKRGNAKDVLEKDWEKIKEEVIKTVQIIKEGTGKVVKAIVETAKKVYEIIVATVVTAVKVLVQLLKLVGLGVKTVVDAVKYVIRWDEVVNTQLAFMGVLKYVRDNSRPILEEKRESIIKTLGSLKGSFTDKIDSVIKNVKGEGETQQLLDAVQQKGGVAEYTYVTDLIVSNSDKASFPNVNQQTVQQVVAQIEIIQTEVEAVGKFPEIVQQCEEVKKNVLKSIGIDIVVALLTLIKGVFGILTDIVSVSADAVIRLFEILVELYWLVMTFEVKIPVVSTLYKYVISNGKYELSLLSLATLPPAIAYTYAYMLTHF